MFQQAITDGVTALFTWGAAGIVVGLFIRQVPLRSAATPAAEPDGEPVTALR